MSADLLRFLVDENCDCEYGFELTNAFAVIQPGRVRLRRRPDQPAASSFPE